MSTQPSSRSRDAALRRLARCNRWLLAGSATLTGAFTLLAAQAFPGRTASAATKGAGTKGKSLHARATRRETCDHRDRLHESPQSSLTGAASRIGHADYADDGNRSDPDPDPDPDNDRTDRADGSNDDRGHDHDARGNGENHRNPGPVHNCGIELVLLRIEHGGLGGIVSAR